MSPLRSAVLALFTLALVTGSPSPAASQAIRVSVPAENFRKEPRVTGSNRLATVFEGAILEVESRQGRWARATLEGWIWSASVSATDRDGFDLVVSSTGGENLREGPDPEARRVGRLLRGMLLDRIESRGSWTRVRRTAWLWAESTIEVDAGAGAAALPEEPVEEAPAPAPAVLPDRILVAGDPVVLRVSPSGDTIASLRPGTDLAVLAREGAWARVRLEGWVSVPSTLPADSALGAGPTPPDVSANPEQYRGRRVQWILQFVSLERAEPARVDFTEGEPFLLTRAIDGDQGFVYVAVPPELLPAAESLRPLQRIEVLGRVRTGRSALMGVPILDLVTLD